MNKELCPVLKRVSHQARFDAIPPEPCFRSAGHCPSCNNTKWFVIRNGLQFFFKCEDCACERPYNGVPGGVKERGGVNHTLERKMGLFDLPPFPPYESEYLSYSVMDTRRLSPVGRNWE